MDKPLRSKFSLDKPKKTQDLSPRQRAVISEKERFNIFRKLEKELAEFKKDRLKLIRDSTTWFQMIVQKNFGFLISSLNTTAFKKVFQNATKPYNQFTPEFGKMYCFFYDPRGRKTLKHYDSFPLVFVVEVYDDSFLGLNLHYLPYKLRLQLFETLYDLAVQNRDLHYDRRLAINYQILKTTTRYKGYRECLKKYLFTNIESQLVRIEDEDWLQAIFIPCERFEGSTKDIIWRKTQASVEHNKNK